MNNELLHFSMEFLHENHIASHLIQNDRWDLAEPFDLGLRSGLGLPNVSPEQWRSHLEQLPPGCLYHYTDSFCCLYTQLRLPDGPIFFIGPILHGADPDALSRDAAARLELSPIFERQLHDYYLRLPKLPEIACWYDSFLRTLGRQLYGSAFRSLSVDYTDLPTANTGAPLQFMPPEKPVLSIQMLEDRYALENRLLDAVHHGDADLAMQALQSFHGVTIPGRKGHNEATIVQFRTVSLNALLRKEAERAEVHPFYLDTLYNDFLLSIGKLTTEQQEQQLVVEMLRQYCDRVARYSTSGYSVVIRNIIHYINLHLKEDLTLSTLAAQFSLSRSYLSDRFRREVQINLTDFVNITRIQFAANLLRYHHYSIAAAAQEVGIPDVSYFTRLFKRSMGETPSQYARKKVSEP